jgi:hypothetical protein
MSEQRMKAALAGLQRTLGVVILIEAILFLMLHGMLNVGEPAIYTAGAWAVATGKGN